jgi:hypothetical protein
MANEAIAEIEKRRYVELAKKQGRLGMDAPAELMVELAALRARYGPVELLDTDAIEEAKPPIQRRARFDRSLEKMNLDLEFVIQQLANLTHRQLKNETQIQVVSRNLYIVGGVAMIALVIVVLYAAHILR